jgi:hypothetical protein
LALESMSYVAVDLRADESTPVRGGGQAAYGLFAANALKLC